MARSGLPAKVLRGCRHQCNYPFSKRCDWGSRNLKIKKPPWRRKMMMTSHRNASHASRSKLKLAQKILVIDIGGTHLKILATGHRTPIKTASGPTMTPQRMVAWVKSATKNWNYDVISMGYPGPVVHNKPLIEPHNLGKGWVAFGYHKAFGCAVKIINDAAMQAIGSYEGGRMLFLGLGTGLGSAMVVDGIVQPMELAHLPYKNGKTYED